MVRATAWVIAAALAGAAAAGVEEVSLPVTSVTAEEIGLKVESSLDLLRGLPVVPPLPGPGAGLVDETLVLIDGVHAGVPPIGNLAAIEEVEVIKGPAVPLWGLTGDSAQWCSYGSGRAQGLGGVVNLVTRPGELYGAYVDGLAEAAQGACAGAPARDCEELRRRAEEAAARARLARDAANRAGAGGDPRGAQASALEAEVMQDRVFAHTLRRQSQDYAELAQASRESAQQNRQRASKYPPDHPYHQEWNEAARFDDAEAERRQQEADRLSQQAEGVERQAQDKLDRADALRDADSASHAAEQAARAAEREARQARDDYERCLHGQAVTGATVARDHPAVADAAAQRGALEQQWNDLTGQQQALEGKRGELTTRLEQARQAGDAAEVRRLEGLLQDVTRAQDAVSAASGAVAEELNVLDEAARNEADALRTRLAAKVNQLAGPAIERRLGTAETLQKTKETVTAVGGYLSSGAAMQSDTARTTRLADRELIAAEEKIAAIDRLLADPAATAAERAELSRMRQRLELQRQAAAEMLAANGRLTAAGYGIDVGLTLCGAKLVQLGKRLVGGLIARVTARRAAAQATTGAVAREGLEAGTTTITQVMERPPVDLRTLGDDVVDEALDRVRRLADEKHGGDFMKALDEVLDDAIGTDILPLENPAEAAAVREALEQALRTTPRAAPTGASPAAGTGGTTVIEDVWRGFSNSGADPNGMTTLFGFGGGLATFGWLQRDFDADPLLGVRGPDGRFTLTLPRLTLDPEAPRVTEFAAQEPPAKLLRLGGSFDAYEFPRHAWRLELGTSYYLALPATFDEQGLPGAAVEVNACRDKLLGPLPDWTAPRTLDALAVPDEPAPRQRVRLRAPEHVR